jgi:hypothetical protein
MVPLADQARFLTLTTLFAPRTETVVVPFLTTAVLLLPTIFRTGSRVSLVTLLAPRTFSSGAVTTESCALLAAMVTGPVLVA